MVISSNLCNGTVPNFTKLCARLQPLAVAQDQRISAIVTHKNENSSAPPVSVKVVPVDVPEGLVVKIGDGGGASAISRPLLPGEKATFAVSIGIEPEANLSIFPLGSMISVWLGAVDASVSEEDASATPTKDYVDVSIAPA